MKDKEELPGDFKALDPRSIHKAQENVMTEVSKERIERAARALARARYLDFCEAFKGDTAGAERYADNNWKEHYSHDAKLVLDTDAVSPPAIDSARAEEREAICRFIEQYPSPLDDVRFALAIRDLVAAIRACTPIKAETDKEPMPQPRTGTGGFHFASTATTCAGPYQSIAERESHDNEGSEW